MSCLVLAAWLCTACAPRQLTDNLSGGISPGETKRFAVSLPEQFYLFFSVPQGHCDFTVSLSSSDRTELAHSDFSRASSPSEYITWVTENAGSYHVDIHAKPLNKPNCTFQILNLDISPADDQKRL